MLGKLLKYELKSTSRMMPIIYGAVLVVGLVLGFLIRIQTHFNETGFYSAPGESTNALLNIAMIAFILIYTLLIVAMEVMTLIMIVMRFYKNLLQGEGYLMHTLPVKTWQLVTSKLIVAVIWEIIAAIVAFASAILLGASSGLLGYIFSEADVWEIIRELVNAVDMNFVLFILLMIVAPITAILQFYFAMAIGNLADKNKLLFSVLAFIGLNIVLSIISAVVGIAPMLLSGSPEQFHIDSYLLRTLIQYAVLGVGFFFGTETILRKKLNLA